MTMLIIKGIVVASLFLIISVLLVHLLQSIDAPTFESSDSTEIYSYSTQANVTNSSSPIPWAVYTNDKFGFIQFDFTLN